MKIWVITDTHLEHNNIIKFCGRTQDHTHRIISNLKVIKEEDLLIHLGDVTMYDHPNMNKAFTQACKGTKILVRGNHDPKSLSWYRDYGWDMVVEAFSLVQFGKGIIFSHKPLDFFGEDINIHGHLHGMDHHMKETEHQGLDGYDRIAFHIEENTIFGEPMSPILLRNLVEKPNDI